MMERYGVQIGKTRLRAERLLFADDEATDSTAAAQLAIRCGSVLWGLVQQRGDLRTLRCAVVRVDGPRPVWRFVAQCDRLPNKARR
jgi:hypothetical protein